MFASVDLNRSGLTSRRDTVNQEISAALEARRDAREVEIASRCAGD